MMSKKKLIGMITIAALLAGLMAMPVMAASRKKIKTVSLKVEASITPETRVGSEDVDVEVKDSAKYSYDTYEGNNSGRLLMFRSLPFICAQRTAIILQLRN